MPSERRFNLRQVNVFTTDGAKHTLSGYSGNQYRNMNEMALWKLVAEFSKADMTKPIIDACVTEDPFSMITMIDRRHISRIRFEVEEIKA